MRPSTLQLRLVREAGEACDQLLPPVEAYGDNVIKLPAFADELAIVALTVEENGWHVHNQSTRLRLVLNERLLNPGTAAALGDGDILEVGLRRYRVEIATAAQLPALGADWLAAVSGQGDFMSPASDPFSLVQSAEEQGASFLIPPEENEDRVADTPPSGDVLYRLQGDYFRALHDPDGGAIMPPPGKAQEEVVGNENEGPDMADLTLEECTTGVLSVDAIMAHFGCKSASRAAWCAPEGDVLWLFAPDSARRPGGRMPPPLTRHEHHLIGIDSAHRIAVIAKATTAGGHDG